MVLNQKSLRYYYWLLFEFFKKNFRLILVTALISTVIVVAAISISPFIVNLFSLQKRVIGVLGRYSYQEMPNEVLSNISNGLFFVNDKGIIVPVLAKGWKLSKDKKTYQVELRPGILWNDGKPFTTQDLNYQFKDVEEKKINDYLIEFKLTKPLPIFLTYLTKPLIKYPLVGVAGVYRVERVKSQYNFINKIQLLPNKKGLKSITYRFYDSETKLINAYKMGEVNEIVITKKSIADIFSSWKNTVVTKTVNYNMLLTVFFNLKNRFLKEKEVREAIGLALDRSKFANLGIEANSPIPPSSWVYNEDLKKNIFDPELAEKLVKKYTESTSSAKLIVNTYYEYLDIAHEINNQINNIGIKTELNMISFNNQMQDFDVLIAFWNVPVDPDQYYFWHSTQRGNFVNYKNLKVDKLLEDGRNTSLISERRQIYYDFQKVLTEDSPAIFIYYPYVYTIKRK